MSYDPPDLELATAALLNDQHDVRFLLKLLSNQLVATLGPRVSIERQGGLLRKSDDIKSLRVTVGGDDFAAVVQSGVVGCSVGHTSGGIRIRSETVGIEEWLSRLLKSLQVEGAHNQSARLALENIVMGGNL